MSIFRTRKTGEISRPHKRTAPQRLGAMLLAILLAFFIVGPTAFAVHDEGLFELDGDATAGGADGDDWSDIGSGALATAFVTDGQAPADETYLKTGDSKDIKDFDEWIPTTTDEAPDKDEILHAFAAGYNDGDGDLIIYFGLDRFDASGDAQVGFWFAQSNVNIVGSSVVGDHQVGDILVLSNFVNGGSVPDIRVFKWVGSGGSDGPIDEVTTSGDPDCNAADPGDERCAIVNVDTEDAPWPFLDKSKSTDYLPGEFYEGGVNLTELGIDQGCITTFIAESRTSQSTDARLKDVAIGGFPLCGISVTKTGDALSKVGDQAHYTVGIENTGAITLYKESIIDDVLGNLTNGSDANITSSNCGASLAAGSILHDPTDLHRAGRRSRSAREHCRHRLRQQGQPDRHERHGLGQPFHAAVPAVYPGREERRRAIQGWRQRPLHVRDHEHVLGRRTGPDHGLDRRLAARGLGRRRAGGMRPDRLR